VQRTANKENLGVGHPFDVGQIGLNSVPGTDIVGIGGFAVVGVILFLVEIVKEKGEVPL